MTWLALVPGMVVAVACIVSGGCLASSPHPTDRRLAMVLFAVAVAVSTVTLCLIASVAANPASIH